MQRGMIKIQREGVFSLPRPRRPNPPAELIRKLRLKQLEPSDPWCDPYILAVLVGLAQSQAQSRSLEKDLDGKGRPDAFKVSFLRLCVTRPCLADSTLGLRCACR
jgi:hypothetical protein